MIQANFKVFEDELLLIQNDDIRSKTITVLEQVNEKFFIAPASSSGKYHPKYALGEGGLVRHTKAAIKIAMSLFAIDEYTFVPDMRDYIIAALILHDTCKSGIDWKNEYSVHEHPLLVSELIENALSPNDPYRWIVGRLIESHMGQWTTSKHSNIVLPHPLTDAQKFVHLCDYLASRNFIDIDFNI